MLREYKLTDKSQLVLLYISTTEQDAMRRQTILLGLAIPLLLTATLFAATTRGTSQINSIFGMLGSSSENNGALTQNSAPQSSDNIVPTAFAASGLTHNIVMSAEPVGNAGLMAYRMVSYQTVDGKGHSTDITSKFPNGPTIPGPTIVITEGDQVFLTLQDNLGPDTQVGVHVHGVHYNNQSDATRAQINNIRDESATTGHPYTYHWVAGPGTAGTWPYHDHVFANINGAENKGLFGMVIVNPASNQIPAYNGTGLTYVSKNAIQKDFVIYMGDNTFWASEISSDGTQKALWTNPTLVAKNGQYVRFHIIPVGTDVHTFKLNGYSFLNPGTSTAISQKDIGPLENLVFTIKGKTGTQSYQDLNTINNLEGMAGNFQVQPSGGSSIASPIPGAI